MHTQQPLSSFVVCVHKNFFIFIIFCGFVANKNKSKSQETKFENEFFYKLASSCRENASKPNFPFRLLLYPKIAPSSTERKRERRVPRQSHTFHVCLYHMKS
jgi:hypothetical protein